MEAQQSAVISEKPASANSNQQLIEKITSVAAEAGPISELIKNLESKFGCEQILLYSVDRVKRQLYIPSIFKNIIPENQIEISPKTLAGYVAITGKPALLPNSHSKDCLSKLHAQLKPGSSIEAKLQSPSTSVFATPLPFNKKLVGVLEIISNNGGKPLGESEVKVVREIAPALGQTLDRLNKIQQEKQSKEAVHKGEILHKISQTIHSAKHVDDILIELKDSILELFDATVITIYAVDSANNEIYSKVKSGDRVDKIRVPISPVSIAGWVAMTQKNVNINDVYKEEELKKYHADLNFDKSWDNKTGFRTKTMLGYPLVKTGELMGVLQIINKKNNENFSKEDEKNAEFISETLALAFHNQSKFVEQKPTKFSYLINNGIITDVELKEATAKARKDQLDIETILLKDYKLKKADLGKSMENFYDMPYVPYTDTMVLPNEILTGLNKNFLIKNFWIPLQSEGNKITILINNPVSQETVSNIKLIFPKREIEFKVGLKSDIIDFFNANLGIDDAPAPQELEGVSSLLNTLKDESEEDVDVSSEDDDANMISETDSTIVRLVNKVLIDAYERGVSDIHIEPGIGKGPILVRYRKDGACTIYEEIPYLYKNAVLSRIKIMSKLDIAERRLPQDGKIRMKYGSKEIEYRVATCPTVGGNEDAVLRILAASKPIPLDKMNFSPSNYDSLVDKIVKPYGLVLVVGPTGSGKTTTLHSALGHINKPETKIWTAEDPVEITQQGLRQVQMLNKIGLDFARAMKSFLRGDPDVIMVGEMRDAETCAIGLEASLTGHLVFSTLHTNSAPETITRLLDMGMNPLNFADALLLIVAQRLVRTLCKNCKEDYHPEKKEFDQLVKEYGDGDFSKLGIEYNDELMLKKPVGCEKCGGTGYAGRTGLHELLEGTDDIKRKIMTKETVEVLREQAIKDGMTTLKQDGIYKIFKGDCDLKQVLAVCIV